MLSILYKDGARASNGPVASRRYLVTFKLRGCCVSEADPAEGNMADRVGGGLAEHLHEPLENRCLHELRCHWDWDGCFLPPRLLLLCLLRWDGGGEILVRVGAAAHSRAQCRPIVNWRASVEALSCFGLEHPALKTPELLR